jgi:hypothetical protein
MRRVLVVALTTFAVLVVGRPAQAFLRHHHSQPGVPVGGATFVPGGGPQYGPTAAAPISPELIAQLIFTGFRFINGIENQRPGTGATDKPQTPSRQMVTSDVRDTISRVDKALPGVVDKSNAISDLNKDLYKSVGVNKITISQPSPSKTGVGPAPNPSGGPFGDD